MLHVDSDGLCCCPIDKCTVRAEFPGQIEHHVATSHHKLPADACGPTAEYYALRDHFRNPQHDSGIDDLLALLGDLPRAA